MYIICRYIYIYAYQSGFRVVRVELLAVRRLARRDHEGWTQGSF